MTDQTDQTDQEIGLKEWMEEAYADCPDEVVQIETIELRHPLFKDADGNSEAIRVHSDRRPNNELKARLEKTAPIDAGEIVVFTGLGFRLVPPKIIANTAPEIKLEIDNVGNMVMDPINQAIQSTQRIEVTYRVYRSDMLDAGPGIDPPITMTLTKVRATPTAITGVATTRGLGNRSFPNDVYTLKKYPSLQQ